VVASGCFAPAPDDEQETQGALSPALKATKLEAIRIVKAFPAKSTAQTGIRTWSTDLYAAPAGLAMTDEKGKPLYDGDKPIILRSAETMIGYRDDAATPGREAVTFEVWVTTEGKLITLPVALEDAEAQPLGRDKVKNAALLADIEALRAHVLREAKAAREAAARKDPSRCTNAAHGLFWGVAELAASTALTVATCWRAKVNVAGVLGCSIGVEMTLRQLESLGDSEIAHHWGTLASCATGP
jgi:hypothetical protein